ncbi:MAG: hypothetical protein Tsb0034_06430 [Ekhidna sp.]
MKTDKKITKSLARTAELVSTINGGSVYPVFETYKEEDHYRLEISVPSVFPENLKVEVSEGDLLVYQNVTIGGLTMPNLLGIIKISAEVALDSISAAYEEGLLTVIMPFSELPGGMNREINILKR